MFINGSKSNPDYRINVLCATSGVGNAGIDCSDVRVVYRLDFPPSILDIAQEKGRAGRRPGAKAEDNHYIMCYSLDSLLTLYKRILNPKETFINESYRTKMQHDIIAVAKLLVLPNACLSTSIELLQGRPLDATSVFPNLPRCESCSNCTATKPTFEAISKSGVKQILLQVFLRTFDGGMAKDMNNVVEFIKAYENAQYLIFRTKVKRFEPVRIKKLLFQMVAWGFLKVAFDSKLEIVVFELATQQRS